MQKKPRVSKKCPANGYAAPGERIVEFSSGAREGGPIGGLVRFQNTDTGLVVEIYRCDDGVKVIGPKVDRTNPLEYAAPQMLGALHAAQMAMAAALTALEEISDEDVSATRGGLIAARELASDAINAAEGNGGNEAAKKSARLENVVVLKGTGR
jgi:hypothetical protein